MQIYYTTDEARTLEIARELGARLRTGDIVLLRGDMGAGKSVFARGLARGLGISSHITSPTFTTMQQYAGPRGNFYHFDLYRMDDPEQLFQTGLNEYIGGDGIAAIEWPENAGLDPEGAYTVRVERVGMDDVRPGDQPVSGDHNVSELADGFARRITIIEPGEVGA